MIGSQISHYRLTRKLGAGTYGEVFEGQHVHDPELRVAVKLVARSLVDDPHFVDALKRECRALDKMDHPNIVRFRELAITESGVAMVLELLDGQDLHERMAGGPLPVDVVVTMIEAILEGLAYAHSRGVMHRDVKPSNVFCCNDGRIKLLDFGIARAADGSQATKTGQMIGTLDYMAPERFDERGGTKASDVYAVGLIAWELLAGKSACPDGEFGRKLGWHLAQGVGDATKVRTAAPGCPGWLAGVIAGLAARDPDARPVDGAAALAMLRAGQLGVERGGGDAGGRRRPPGTVVGPATAPKGLSAPSSMRPLLPAALLAPAELGPTQPPESLHDNNDDRLPRPSGGVPSGPPPGGDSASNRGRGRHPNGDARAASTRTAPTSPPLRARHPEEVWKYRRLHAFVPVVALFCGARLAVGTLARFDVLPFPSAIPFEAAQAAPKAARRVAAGPPGDPAPPTGAVISALPPTPILTGPSGDPAPPTGAANSALPPTPIQLEPSYPGWTPAETNNLFILLAVMFAGKAAWGATVLQAARNARVLAPDRAFTFSPLWAVGWYCVPFVNLYRPYQALLEIWMSSGDENGVGILLNWWTFFVTANLASLVYAVLVWSGRRDPEVGVICAAVSWVELLSALLFLWALAKRQDVSLSAKGQ